METVAMTSESKLARAPTAKTARSKTNVQNISLIAARNALPECFIRASYWARARLESRMCELLPREELPGATPLAARLDLPRLGQFKGFIRFDSVGFGRNSV